MLRSLTHGSKFETLCDLVSLAVFFCIFLFFFCKESCVSDAFDEIKLYTGSNSSSVRLFSLSPFAHI